MSYFVYILYSPSTNSFYKGQTADLSDRLKRHNNKQESATKNGAPWTLLWFTKKRTRSEALVLERKLKNLSREKTLQFIKKYHSGDASPDVF